MKLDEDGYWYQKPSYTNPLRYKYVPTNECAWVHEGYNGITNQYFRNENFTYESEIYFIEYTTPHTYEYQRYGGTQHVRVCTICGETGTPTPCIYINNVCKGCGRIKITGGGIITSVNKEDGE